MKSVCVLLYVVALGTYCNGQAFPGGGGPGGPGATQPPIPGQPPVGPNPPAGGPNPPAAGPNPPAAGPNPPAAGPNPPAAGPNQPAAGPVDPAARPGQPDLGGGGAPVNPEPPVDHPVGLCDDLWLYHKGSCYRHVNGVFEGCLKLSEPAPTNYGTDGKSQATANMICDRCHVGATLVTINNKEENDYIYKMILGSQPDPVWTGFHSTMGGQWAWYSGEPVTYTNFDPRQVDLMPGANGVMVPFGEPLRGAVLFDGQQVQNRRNNPVDSNDQWKLEDVDQRRSFVCEYKLNSQPSGSGPASGPLKLSGNPANDNAPIQGAFGGSGLHEVPRRRNRPMSYRMRPAYAIQP